MGMVRLGTTAQPRPEEGCIAKGLTWPGLKSKAGTEGKGGEGQVDRAGDWS